MKIIRLKAVLEITALSKSSVYAFIKEGQFPKQVSLGSKAVGWVEAEVMAWVKQRIDCRDQC